MKPEEHLKQIKKFVVKGYGKRCKDHYYCCFICEIYEALDILGDALNTEKSYKKIH